METMEPLQPVEAYVYHGYRSSISLCFPLQARAVHIEHATEFPKLRSNESLRKSSLGLAFCLTSVHRCSRQALP
jgi:hypothetical protein